ncbi:hypothetical protein D9K81_14700 [Acinetobacter chengduensis]|uniref:Uncharacterized protein n=2 Tax=Acinetobacter chengduensis TaxID=2420890 RepID=A0ABX9TTC6_9GAMM|nr:hypothetical protein D9K81_14700 [Acinetobacter chengduensis]
MIDAIRSGTKIKGQSWRRDNNSIILKVIEMANPIEFIVTNAGRDAFFDAKAKGIKLLISKIGLGSGQYQPAVTRTALSAEFTQKTISAGGIELESFALRFTVIMSYSAEKNVSEVGLYTDKGVLFAVASQPTGSYFRLYPGIDFVASMGLLLKSEDLAKNITVVSDGTAGQALQVMNAHLAETDPHPQYKEFSRQLMREHLADEDPHPQYAKKSYLAEKMAELDEKVGVLLDVTAFIFPPALACGYDTASKAVAERKKGAIFSYADTSMVYLFTPESQHEGWSSIREAERITTSIYDRSGTNRVDYLGRSNYAVIDTAKLLNKNGLAGQTDQLANMIKAGTIEAGQNPTIQRIASDDLKYTSDQLAVLVCPEGEHEGWSITRKDDSITIDVFNRSGVSRATYAGRINWALFKVNAVPSATRSNYPLNLTTGVASSGDFVIPAPAGHDFTNPTYFPVITPESSHEGWTIKRTSAGFEVSVFSRSGSNRTTYTGKVSWAVFAIERPMKRTVYYEGSHKIVVPVGRVVRFALYGPGGGGGASRRSTQTGPVDGGNAGSTKITKSSLVLEAGGGFGGTGGIWGNGSSFINGEGGKGGENIVSNLLAGMKILRNVAGNAAIIGNRSITQPGGVATSLDSGLSESNAGGTGGRGVGDEDWSYGGGGGSGGYLLIEFENTSDQSIEFDLSVGKPGARGITQNLGNDGGIGFAIVLEEV